MAHAPASHRDDALTVEARSDAQPGAGRGCVGISPSFAGCPPAGAHTCPAISSPAWCWG